MRIQQMLNYRIKYLERKPYQKKGFRFIYLLSFLFTFSLERKSKKKFKHG